MADPRKVVMPEAWQHKRPPHGFTGTPLPARYFFDAAGEIHNAHLQLENPFGNAAGHGKFLLFYQLQQHIYRQRFVAGHKKEVEQRYLSEYIHAVHKCAAGVHPRKVAKPAQDGHDSGKEAQHKAEQAKEISDEKDVEPLLSADLKSLHQKVIDIAQVRQVRTDGRLGYYPLDDAVLTVIIVQYRYEHDDLDDAENTQGNSEVGQQPCAGGSLKKLE